MPTLKDAQRAVQSKLVTKQDVIPWKTATLGDGHGTVSTGNNMVYCRLSENSSVIEVLNLRCAPVDGLRVRIAKTPEMPLVWQVIGQDDQRADENGNNGGGINYGGAGPHHKSHEYLGGDQINLDWRQITTLRVYATSGLIVGVLPGLLPRVGADLVVPFQTLDLTTHKPTSGARYCLISVDSTGAIVATDGAIVASKMLLTLAYIPDTPNGNFRLAAVRLYAGQSNIVETTVNNDIRDLRWPQERLAGDVYDQFGAQNASTVFSGPTSGSASAPFFRPLIENDIPSSIARLSDIADAFVSLYPNTTQTSTPGATWYNSDATAPGDDYIDLWTADTAPIYFIGPELYPQSIKAGSWRCFCLFQPLNSSGGFQVDVTLQIRHSDTTLTTIAGPTNTMTWLIGIGVFGRRIEFLASIASDVTLVAGDQVVVKFSNPQYWGGGTFTGARCYVGEQTEGTPAFSIPGGFSNVALVSPPASSSDTGTAGQMAYDTNYLYVCVDTDTWTRIALAW